MKNILLKKKRKKRKKHIIEIGENRDKVVPKLF